MPGAPPKSPRGGVPKAEPPDWLCLRLRRAPLSAYLGPPLVSVALVAHIARSLTRVFVVDFPFHCQCSWLTPKVSAQSAVGTVLRV